MTTHFAIGSDVSLVAQMLVLRVVRNAHGAMGFFGGRPLALIALAIAAAAFVFALLRATLTVSSLAQIGFGMVLGGALGNIVDRIAHGYVIDFIAFARLFIFNVGDAGISIGLVLIGIGALRANGPRRAGA